MKWLEEQQPLPVTKISENGDCKFACYGWSKCDKLFLAISIEKAPSNPNCASELKIKDKIIDVLTCNPVFNLTTPTPLLAYLLSLVDWECLHQMSLSFQ